MKNNKADPILSQKKPWQNNSNSVWLASAISLYRNIEKYKFPIKLEADRQKQIVSLISKELLSNPSLKNPKLLYATELTPLQKEYLMEHYLSQHSFHQAHSGEAFIIDETGEFLVELNLQDHIHFQLIDTQGEVESTWNNLVSIETALGRQVSYAFSSKYGFLTSNFALCGTAFNLAVYLQVPGLVHSGTIDQVLEKLADESLLVTGIQGNPTEIIGDILVVQNNYTLSLTEENIISSLRTFITKIQLEENNVRKKVLKDDSRDIKDKVSRAFGILMHSYQIETVEALNALSLFKLGVELNWLTGISLLDVNQLFFNCRRAHLLQQFGENLKPEEIPHKRAEYLHKNLKNVQLVI